MSGGLHVVLHIGTEKTGTTTLQSVLAAHRERLHTCGIGYLTTPGRVDARGLAAAALEDRIPDDYLYHLGRDAPAERAAFRTEAVDALRADVAALPADIHTVVLSSEHFHSRLRRPSEVAWLGAVLGEWAASVRVVAYLRRQVDVMASFYSTELKNGGRRTLAQAAEKLCHPGNHYFDYHRMLGLWAEHFGAEAITPRVMAPGELQGDRLVEDFLGVLGVADLHLPDPDRGWLNESVTPLGQGLLRGINTELARRGAEDPVAASLRELRQEVLQAFRGKGATLPLKEARRLQAAFDEANAAVCARWFPGRERLFEPVNQATYPVRQGEPALSEEQLDLVRRILDAVDDEAATGNPLKPFDACAILLRDAAVAREDESVAEAQARMGLAGRIRPKGPFIHNRLAHYRELRSLRGRLRRLLGRCGLGRQ